MKKRNVILIVSGLAVIVASLLITVIIVNSLIDNGASLGIIGGASGPTYFMSYMIVWKDFRIYTLAYAGTLSVILGFALKKK